MSTILKFSDIQNYLDAILAKTGVGNPTPHGVFWRKTGNYNDDYKYFTTSAVPKVNVPILDQQTPLNSNFYQALVNDNFAYGQMPAGGPYITDPGYTVTIGSVTLTGGQIKNNIAEWLTNNFPA